MHPLTPLARELLAGPHFAIVATVNADGSPQQSVVWARERDGEGQPWVETQTRPRVTVVVTPTRVTDHG